MPVNTIELPKALRGLVDRFVLRNPLVEYGGFILGTPLRFESFYPVPNFSNDPRREFAAPSNWESFVTTFAEAIGKGVVAHFHTHPSHSIPSGQDIKSGGYWFRAVTYMILIAPNKEGNKTSWWVLDRNHEVQEIAETDRELEDASLLLARRYGFADLGHVLMDSDGALRTTGEMARVLLTNEDARILYSRLIANRQKIKKGEAAKIGGMSASRARVAFKVLQEAGLLKEDWTGFETIDIFGRRL